MLFSNKDLKKLLIPLFLETFLNMAIGLMDTMMVSSCGEAAVSGVSLVDSVNILLINVFSALATGGAVVVAQYIGQKNRTEAEKSAKMLFYVVLISSTAIMAVCLVLRNSILSLLFGSIADDVMASAQTYFLIVALSYPFIGMYNGAAALSRCMGNAKATLQVSLVMNVINIAGNALCIYWLGMGVAGAALATLISRIVASVAMMYCLHNPANPIRCPKLLQFEWYGSLVKKVLQIGVPNGLEGGLFQMGKLLLLSLVATFGTASTAANAVAGTIASFECLPGNAVGLALVTVVGQCAGAGAYDQARAYTRKLMKLCYLCLFGLNIIIILGSRTFLGLYNLSEETLVMAQQVVYLHGVGCMLIWPMSFALPNVLRAAGDTLFVMVVSSVSMICFRIAFGYLFALTLGFGMLGTWMAMQVDWIFRSACFILRYRGTKWQTKAVV